VRSRSFGRTGVEVPIIGLGSWNTEHDERAEVIRSIRRAVDLGMTHLDTAELYGSGKVEEILKEALRGLRDRVFLTSKVMPNHASYRGTIRALEQSLSRLGTDHLDLYLIHWPSEHPLEDTLRAFEESMRAGKIRAYGVSNFDILDLEKSVRIAGEGKIACNQVLYHLEERDVEHRVLPWCRRHDIALVGYSPFGSSRSAWVSESGQRVLEEIGRAHGVTAHAIALAFLVREEGTFAIPKAASVAHVEANACAGDIVLSDDEIARIDRAFAKGKPRRSLATI
jgi:diketogulonate reductase-like aldo/keto reductase